MTNIERMAKIIDHYGPEHQKLKAVEELTELQEIILKDVNKGGIPAGIAEELADVKIMLTQMLMIYDVDPEELRDIIDYKLERTLKRMK